MSPERRNYASIRKPPLRERFWRLLGFRYHLGDEPNSADDLNGWNQTTVCFCFDWKDRLRLLLTGKLKVLVVNRFCEPVTPPPVTRHDWMILPPGDRSLQEVAAREMRRRDSLPGAV
jgi:hypothetical protein